MARTVSDFLLDRLVAWGVRRVFGYPGDGINGLLGALQRRQGELDFVQVRHEEMAAFMACGHAKFSGGVGVCLATSGPGAIHLLNGLYDAKCDHQPVVAIVGQQPRPALGGHQQQEVDLAALFKDVAGAYCHMVSSPAQLPNVVDRAVRIALAERTVTCLIVPADVQTEAAVEETPHAQKFVPGGVGYRAPRVLPHEGELRRAAELLNQGQRVAMLVGQGARGAKAELLEVADRLGAGVAKALLGKDVLPDDLPFVTGSIGLLGTDASTALMRGCDTLLMVGSSFPYSEYLPAWGQARGVQIDLSGSMIGIRYPMEVNLVGGAQETLQALLPLLERKADRSWRERVEASTRAWWSLLEARAFAAANPINPQRVFWELSARLPDLAIVTCDSGSAAAWYARDLVLRRGMRGSLSGTLATMGCAVPYALAAKLAHPDRPVIACVGDGAMQMNGMNELLTIARCRARWQEPTFVVLVLNNGDLNMVTWEQRALAGDRKFEASQSLPPFDYAAHARLCGLQGVTLRDPEAIGATLDEALRSKVPVVIDAHVDPEVPIVPPQVTAHEAGNLARSLLGGDLSVDLVKNVARQLFPGRPATPTPPPRP